MIYLVLCLYHDGGFDCVHGVYKDRALAEYTRDQMGTCSDLRTYKVVPWSGVENKPLEYFDDRLSVIRQYAKTRPPSIAP